MNIIERLISAYPQDDVSLLIRIQIHGTTLWALYVSSFPPGDSFNTFNYQLKTLKNSYD